MTPSTQPHRFGTGSRAKRWLGVLAGVMFTAVPALALTQLDPKFLGADGPGGSREPVISSGEVLTSLLGLPPRETPEPTALVMNDDGPSAAPGAGTPNTGLTTSPGSTPGSTAPTPSASDDPGSSDLTGTSTTVISPVASPSGVGAPSPNGPGGASHTPAAGTPGNGMGDNGTGTAVGTGRSSNAGPGRSSSDGPGNSGSPGSSAGTGGNSASSSSGGTAGNGSGSGSGSDATAIAAAQAWQASHFKKQHKTQNHHPQPDGDGD